MFDPILSSVFNSSGYDDSSVISWASPVPYFGKAKEARVATMGINPSNLEFVDSRGVELKGQERRFHTLSSLLIKSWPQLTDKHIHKITDRLDNYFNINPYGRWFNVLDLIINGTNTSFYAGTACHIDLVPFATSNKWSDVPQRTKDLLIETSAESLAHTLKNSPIKLLILNGVTVVNSLEKSANIELDRRKIPNWSLPRKNGKHVQGYSYMGEIESVGGIKFNRAIRVLGYNHNLQSSFGVTTDVKKSIQKWIAEKSKSILQ